MDHEFFNYTVVAKRDVTQQNNTGVVKILFVYNKDKVLQPPDDSIFRAKKVWISKDYDQIVDQFSETDIFILDSVMASDKDYEEHRADWWSTGNHAKPKADSELVPVIESDLPDIGTGFFDYEGDLSGRAFFKVNNFVYGPFDISTLNNQYKAEPYSMPVGTSDHIAKISVDKLFETNVLLQNEETDNHFISSVNDFKQNGRIYWELVDFISNEKLLKLVNNRGQSRNTHIITKKSLQSLTEEVKNFLKKGSVPELAKIRHNRATELLLKFKEGESQENIYFEEFINTFSQLPIFKSEIERITLESNPTTSAIIQVPEKEHQNLKKEIQQFENRALQLRDEIFELEEKKRNETNNASTEYFNSQSEELKSSLIELRAKHDSITSEIEVSQLKIEKIRHEEELVDDIVGLSARKSVLSVDVNELSRTFEEIKDQLRGNKFATELGKQHVVLKTLREGIDFNDDTPQPFKKPHIASTIPSEGHDIISEISKYLGDDQGRHLSDFEVANILICMQQNFITFLQGKPGVGKTSSAIRLSKALFLLEDDFKSDSFLNIPVARGWASTRDILGFYNSLKGVYQPARTGLYNFLKSGQDEQSKRALRIVLLDEANLSPIEHYWSDFIGMCDPEGAYRSIDTGMKDNAQYLAPNAANNLRFIASINNDATTEPLSPRLIDRAPVISMDLEDDRNLNQKGPFKMDGAIPIELLEQFFGRDQTLDSDGQDTYLSRALLANFLTLAQDRNKEYGKPIDISRRKQIAIAHYVHKAIVYMDEKPAIDFALSQFVLPTIRGDSSAFKNRLIKMYENANNNDLNRTAEILDRIIQDGDQYLQNYTFL